MGGPKSHQGARLPGMTQNGIINQMNMTGKMSGGFI